MKCQAIKKATKRGDIAFVDDSFMIYLSHHKGEDDEYLDIYDNKISYELYSFGWDTNRHEDVAIFRKSPK